MDFDSLNVYQSLQALTANSPEELVALIRSIKTPVKVISFVQVGARSVAYVIGDVRIQTKLKKVGVPRDGSTSKG
jgi:hypothetical protein